MLLSLATNISTALHGVCSTGLDATYKSLWACAKEGMADIASEYLHSIGNILNSINVFTYSGRMYSPVIDDVAGQAA